MQNLIRLLPDILQPAVVDTTRHVASDAYMAFFKDISYAPRVRDVLQKVSTGAPIPQNTRGDKPWIYCVTRPNQVIIDQGLGSDLYLDSLADGRLAQTNVGVLDSQFIFLFPGFWKEPSVPSASPRRCLTLLPHFNKYREDGRSFISYQIWTLVHELVHQYAADLNQGSEGEAMYVNDCVQLPASKAVANAQNYVYYIASK